MWVRSGTASIELACSPTTLSVKRLGGGSTSQGWDMRSTAVPFVDRVWVDNHTVQLKWQRRSATASADHRKAGFRFATSDGRFEMISDWSGAATSGPIEHSLTFVNHTNEPVVIGAYDSLDLDFKIRPEHRYRHWWVEKGAGGPTQHGTHRDPVAIGYSSAVKSTPYSEDKNRDGIPWSAVEDETAGRGWYAGIEFSGIVQIGISRPSARDLSARIGLSSMSRTGSVSKFRVLPRESWRLPTVFVGCYEGDVDDGSNQLRHWVERSVKPKSTDTRLPLAALNTWGIGMKIDEARCLRLIDDAKSLGMELFHVDAGWFTSIGDWRPNPAKFPNGLLPLSTHAHAEDLKFGLWVGWTQGGIGPEQEHPSEILNAFSPERQTWFASPPIPSWKPSDFTGSDVCLGDTEAQQWSKQLLNGLVSRWGVDMLEHDQPMVVSRCVQRTHPHTDSDGDVAYRAALGYYSVYDQVRRGHPNLLFEDCVNGGRMVDYGVIRRAHYISISDTYSPLANRQVFYDASYAIPPSMCECYVSWVPTKSDAQFVAMLRSGMMGWFTLMQDPADWRGRQRELAKREIAIYKSRIRPLIQSGNLYHVGERPVESRWDGTLYASADGRHAVLMAFRGAAAGLKGSFAVRGLRRATRYQVTAASDPALHRVALGTELMEKGIALGRVDPGGSEIVFIDAKSVR